MYYMYMKRLNIKCTTIYNIFKADIKIVLNISILIYERSTHSTISINKKCTTLKTYMT